MLLSDIVARNQPVALAALSLHPGLAAEIQERLGRTGILDPPADGDFGPVSRWALDAFAGSQTTTITPEVADRLLQATALPLTAGDPLTEQLLNAMTARGCWLSRLPGCVNIVYIEGMGPGGAVNDNRPNRFNDARFVLAVGKGGVVTMAGAWEATTEPGKKFTETPENPVGAARISFGQFKAWSVGNHKNRPDHEALVQVSAITIYRDRNKDYRRDGDPTQAGAFGINQHHGWGYSADDIRDASAGCLVGRSIEGHKQFMKIVKTDPRYGASRGYRFMTSILDATSLAANIT